MYVRTEVGLTISAYRAELSTSSSSMHEADNVCVIWRYLLEQNEVKAPSWIEIFGKENMQLQPHVGDRPN